MLSEQICVKHRCPFCGKIHFMYRKEICKTYGQVIECTCDKNTFHLKPGLFCADDKTFEGVFDNTGLLF